MRIATRSSTGRFRPAQAAATVALAALLLAGCSDRSTRRSSTPAYVPGGAVAGGNNTAQPGPTGQPVQPAGPAVQPTGPAAGPVQPVQPTGPTAPVASFAGHWTGTDADGQAVEMTLALNGDKLTGSARSAADTYTIDGAVEGLGASGRVVSQGQGTYWDFRAALIGGSTMTFTLIGEGGAKSVLSFRRATAPQTIGTSAAPPPQTPDPAQPTPPAAASFAGNWTGTGYTQTPLALTFQQQGNRLTGHSLRGNEGWRFDGSVSGQSASGTVAIEGSTYAMKFAAGLSGDTMKLKIIEEGEGSEGLVQNYDMRRVAN
ncbi:MAG: hypothetical protein BIFFINMI_03513 [Phycisphaerae bacterium]|nr:hypothetical protein [Phycisphaerae bacterium]